MDVDVDGKEIRIFLDHVGEDLFALDLSGFDGRGGSLAWW